jgi:tryptophanyl-tRNA synthetase
VKVLFTGIQPTGELHLGNYFGAVANWVKLQHDYTSYISVVDLHAVTIPYEPAEMPARVMGLATTLYACGIDMEKTRLFVQSEVPGHADLTWLFNSITPLGELERMTQFKDKREQFRASLNVGLLDYPVLQAADILIYKGDVVPVGEDQVQHVEFTREVARHFNARYGQTFPECQALLTPTPRVMGLDGESKMSKSKGNSIGILETPEEIWKKLGPAKTDPARVRRSDPGTPEKCNIWSYHKLVTGEPELAQIHTGCTTAGIGCIDCKKVLHKNLMKVLDPIRDRHAELAGSKQREVAERLEANAESCRAVASETILEVKSRMGLSKVWKIKS